MTAIVLIGVSLPPAEAARQMGLEVDVIADPGEDLDRVRHLIRRAFVRPYRSKPASALDVPSAEEYAAAISTTELGLLPASLFAAYYRVGGLQLEAVLASRSKFLMRERLKAETGATILYGLDLGTRPRDISLIAKPVDGSGGNGVAELIDDDDADAAHGGGILWEQKIDGEEYCIDAVSFGGAHHILGVTGKQKDTGPGFAELAQIFPADLPTSVAWQIADEVSRTLTALGHTTGSSHTELKVNAGQIGILETQTRPGGDEIPRIMRTVLGLDEYQLAIGAHLGKDPGPAIHQATPHGVAAVLHIRASEERLLSAATVPALGLSSLSSVEELPRRADPGFTSDRRYRIFLRSNDRETLSSDLSKVNSVIGRHAYV